MQSNGYAFWVDLAPTPTYKEMATAPMRQFAWTFSLPASTVVKGVLPDMIGGTYRLHVRVPTTAGDKTVDSSAFAVQ